jgi:HAD superfamily hydrolase (TIGR01490 family)
MGKVQEVRALDQAAPIVGDSGPLAAPEVEGNTYTYRRGNGLRSLLKPCKVRYRFTRLIVKRWRSMVAYAVTVRIRFARRLYFRFLRSVVFFGFRLWLRRIHNPEKLPKAGPALIVSNHVSYYDWSVLASVLRKQTVFLGAKDLQTRPIVRWLIKLNTLIYIDRDNPGLSYFREVIRQLREKQVVVVYPEGRRSRTGKRQPARLGFIKLALVAKVPIIPVGMKGTYEILPPHKRLPRFKRCEIFVGDPIFVSPESALFQDLFALAPDHLSEEILQEMAERVMDEIAKMLGPEWDGGVLKRRLAQRAKGVAPIPHSTQRKVAAFFDVDRTIVRGQTQMDLALFFYARGLFPLWSLAKAIAWASLARYNLVKDTQRLRESLYGELRKFQVKEWELVFDEFVDSRLAPKIFRSARDLILDHKKRGHLIVLVSASLEPIIARLQKMLGADAYIATRLESLNGCYTGRILGEIMEGSAKAAAIIHLAKEYQIDLSQSYGYSDGFSDVRWLAKVGCPTIINPDRKLSIFARRRQWGITQFLR